MQLETRIEYAKIIREVVDRLQSNLEDPPTFRDLAETASISPFHFHRIFRAMVGESPAELVRRLRLERGAWQLRHGRTPVTEIAFDAGYATLEAFSKSFQSGFGISPSGFRRGNRECCGIRARNNLHYYDGGFTLFNLIDHGDIDMKTEVIERNPQRVVGLHHKGPYHEIGEAFGRLGPAAEPLGLFELPGADMVAIYMDDPETKSAEDLDSLAGVTVPEDAKTGDLEEAQLSGGRYFKAEFIGHYGGLGEAWGAVLGKLLPESGHQIRDGLLFEIYMNNCNDTPPEKLRTDIYVPIA